jgi:hypothetical protein
MSLSSVLLWFILGKFHFSRIDLIFYLHSSPTKGSLEMADFNNA